MERVPIKFDYKGGRYAGIFTQVNGAGGTVFHLTIDDFFYGQLILAGDIWYFHSNKNFFPGMAEEFGEYIIAWFG